MHNFRVNYDKFLEVLKGLGFQSESFLYQIRKPKLSDLGIIALTFTTDYMSVDSEHQLFRILPFDFHSVIERSVYNRRKRKLFFQIELVRKKLADILGKGENCFIVDSMPLEVCKLSRRVAGVRFVRKQTMPGQIKAIVLRKSCIIMAISYMLYAR